MANASTELHLSIWRSGPTQAERLVAALPLRIALQPKTIFDTFSDRIRRSISMLDFACWAGLEEARAYLAHPVLGPRLDQCTRIVLESESPSLHAMFGSPDDLKFRSSMTLFWLAADDPDEYGHSPQPSNCMLRLRPTTPQDNGPLSEADRCAAKGAPKHNLEARDRRHQVSFNKPNWRSQMISMPISRRTTRHPRPHDEDSRAANSASNDAVLTAQRLDREGSTIHGALEVGASVPDANSRSSALRDRFVPSETYYNRSANSSAPCF